MCGALLLVHLVKAEAELLGHTTLTLNEKGREDISVTTIDTTTVAGQEPCVVLATVAGFRML